MAQPYGGYGAPPQPAQPGYGGAAPPPGGYGGAPPPGGYGGAPAPGGFGGAPPAAGGFGGAPPAAGYGGAPPAGYGQQPGAPAPGGFGGAPGYGAAPGVNPQVVQWFQAVDSDRSGKISVLELQQALTNANWSHFNAETCRLMIGMFDRDNSGTIDLNEFQSLWSYIHQWKGIFERFDNDRSGHIEAGELCNAFNTLGYRLSQQFSQLLVCRYDIQARSRLSLDNFIQSCVLLKSMTDTFRQKDPQGTGQIRINYEEFMTMCMLNKP